MFVVNEVARSSCTGPAPRQHRGVNENVRCALSERGRERAGRQVHPVDRDAGLDREPRRDLGAAAVREVGAVAVVEDAVRRADVARDVPLRAERVVSADRRRCGRRRRGTGVPAISNAEATNSKSRL